MDNMYQAINMYMYMTSRKGWGLMKLPLNITNITSLNVLFYTVSILAATNREGKNEEFSLKELAEIKNNLNIESNVPGTVQRSYSNIE